MPGPQFRKALAVRPGHPEILGWMEGLRPDAFARARELARLGELSRARDAVHEVLEEDPRARVPADLGYLFGDGWPWWTKIRNRGLALFPTVLSIAVPVLVGLVGLGAILRLVSILFRRRVMVEAFESSADTVPSGGGFTRLVQTHLLDLAHSAGSLQWMLASRPESINIPEIVRWVRRR